MTRKGSTPLLIRGYQAPLLRRRVDEMNNNLAVMARQIAALKSRDAKKYQAHLLCRELIKLLRVR